MYARNEKIVPVYIEEEVKDSYLNYAMSVIVGRALPDVRDGLKPVHRRILYAMQDLGLEHTKPFKKAARIVGECFVKDALVLTEKGLIPIQNIVVGDKVYTQNGLHPVAALYEMPPRTLLRITLDNGIYNEVTPSQKIKVLDQDLGFIWKEAKDLTDKDYIVIRSHYPDIKGPVELEFPYLGAKKNLNKNTAYLLGCLLSDGWISSDYGQAKHPRLGFYSTNRDVVEMIVHIFLREFGYQPTIEERKHKVKGENKVSQNTGYTIRINRLDINEFFVKNFCLEAKKAPTKEIPTQIFISPKEVIFSFVSGLIEGDGSIHQRRNIIHYGSVSSKLIDQLAILLQHFGIFSSRYVDKNLKRSGFINDHYIKANYEFYYLELRSSSALLLAKNICSFDETKQNRIYSLLSARKFPFSHDIIPCGGEHIFKELTKFHLGSGWYQDTNGQKFRMGIKYPTGCKIRHSSDLLDKPLRKSQIISWNIREKLERIGSPLSSFAENLIENDIYFVRVISKEEIPPQKTYDLQVEGEHEFIANGMIAHNCLGKYHPHGDIAVYDALVRMAQDFSLRYPLVKGQGNFGCFTRDTKVRLTDGRELSFTELIKENKAGKKNYTFTFNPKTQKVEIAQIQKPRLTRKKAELVKVVLDNGVEIKCTPDHPFMLRDGTYKKAKDLKRSDSLMPLYIKPYDGKDDFNLKGYEVVYQPMGSVWEFIHRIADEWNIKNEIYPRSAGRIRHHKDFNKLNNNPDNIERIQWGKHWIAHKSIASERHKNDPEYVKRLAEGRKRFWEDPRVRKEASLRWTAFNQRNWGNPKYRERMSAVIRQAWQRPEYRARITEASSKNLKKLWQQKEFQELLSKLKSEELKNKWKDQSYRDYISGITRKTSLKIWSNSKHREFISQISKKRWENLEYRQGMARQARELWQDPEYRSKYPKDHFRQMAKALWGNPKARQLHRAKARKQWENVDFKLSFIRGVIQSNRKRLQQDPDAMYKLAQKAAVALRKKWQDPLYRERVAKSRILGFVSSLMTRDRKVTPELYEERRQQGLPHLKTALKYFSSFDDMCAQVQQRLNHKVEKVEFLKYREDVYDLTIEPWHNFALASGAFVHNSIDGDSAAAMRYTECRLAAIADEMLADIEKETVDFGPNFDASLKEPLLLPAVLPNLLINGSSGIAVGMATNIPPHNLPEVCDAIIHLLDNPEAVVKDLMRYIKGPDFPTGGIICGRGGIKDAYNTGRGKLVVRAKATIEHQKNGKDLIVITEIPYQVQKSGLIEAAAGLVEEKKIEGISDIRDESDRDGMRIVVELKRDAEAQVILNQLFKHTQLENTFGIIMLALVNNRPKVLNLRQILDAYVEHRKEIIRRRTRFELDKALKRAHILEGLKIALKFIDRIIKTIKTSKDTDTARQRLVKEFGLSEIQAQAILEMQLQRLTALERDKIDAEYAELLKKIEACKAILASEKKVEAIIKEELEGLKKKYGDERRTDIVGEVEELEVEDLIAEEDVVVTISHGGYIKRLPVSAYRKQKRGGRGATGAEVKDEDFIEHLFVASTKDYLLIFTGEGQVYWLRVFEIPQASRISKGRAIVNLTQIKPGVRISATIPVKEFTSDKYLVMVTKGGQIKKTNLDAYSNPRKGGIIGITLDKDDELIAVELTDGKQELLIGTRQGKAIRFPEEKVRDMGRAAKGVRGISLARKDEVMAMVLAQKDTSILTVTSLGFTKRTPATEYRLTSRGGKGIINIKVTDKNGEAVSLKTVSDKDELMVITQNGMFLRCAVKDVRSTGRSAQGVRLIKLQEKDSVSCVARVIADEGE